MNRSRFFGLVFLFCVAVCLIAVPCLAAPTGVVRSSPVDLDVAAFRAELDRWSELIALVEKGSVTPEELRASLPKQWLVHDGGQRFEIPTGRLHTALGQLEHPNAPRASLLRSLRSELLALRQEAEGLTRPGNVPGPEAAQQLQQILSRREFRAVRPPSAAQLWVEHMVGKLFELIARILARLSRSSMVGRALIWVLIGLAFLVLVLLLRRAMRSEASETRLRLDPAAPLAKAWRDWAREALDAASRGDYRAALHAAYWVAVYRLEERGIWTVDRSRTPREYLSLLEPQSVHRPPLAALTRRFEITWYGCRHAAAEDFREALAELEVLGCRFPSVPATAQS
ncbi:MAG: DUF4129 domain-containing protein [Acidobacteria bacterium]|nr:DUF4129 domain-containing protein [Acidobacteriota bacterium]MBI3663039.1 DUF4129 domain-containing protein [Acidobacteriota bacterium]